ncbi:probable GTP-binding protein [Thermococcus onnurineus NA1]|uniref:Probable GTP-binding protein EngB n=1 Tax=Thermococcus onnurineus (strain NA1) TaxID=523850 RepID=B6YW73_THEON|nr:MULTISPECIES: GTP-binding protein EngB [Thermococcus]ACJ17439.1 probable GTP-binding protein [Thermococcus onnurineus NA1]NJE45825.1 GTP-binding protein EngB [Thermococcus sp. GR7]NJE79213.1 GTP-binding protein EngB [Thermococcus sp. GR4]NJF22019.1 GTP-binding protein EngB [Thermococcus sp. GR5]
MIIFVGRSNVGKSTLIFRLTGKWVRRGKRPGVTRKPVEVSWRNRKVVDMPGFGFMSGLPKEKQEKIKDEIVHFIENNADEIDLAILVIDGKSVLEIIERWEKRGEIPIDVEFFQFLRELKIPTIVAVNKIDKVKNVQGTITRLAEKFGVPYSEINEIFVPISAKFGKNLDELRMLIEKKLREGRKPSEDFKDDVGNGLLDAVE